MELIESRSCRDLMRQHLEQIQDSLEWLDTHSFSVEVDDTEVRVYRSDLYANNEEFDAWFNALVQLYLSSVTAFDREGEQAEVKKRYRSAAPKPDLTMKDVVCGGYVWPEEVMAPFLKDVATRGRTDSRTGNGIVLFGPAGAGKTTLAEIFAAELRDWDFLQLTTADFLSGGYDGVFRTIRNIFGDLQKLRKCVVFFDELELLIIDREGLPANWNAGVITNVMLPELQALHDCEYVIPVLATNHIRKFDDAGRRPGRFDFVLPVDMPCKKERRAAIESIVLDKDKLFVGIEDIPEGGAVREVIQWATDYRDLPDADYEAAKRLWDDSFKRTVTSGSQIEDFLKDVRDYAYPPCARERDE